MRKMITAMIELEDYQKMQQILKIQDKSFSSWIRLKIKEELEKISRA